MRAVFYALIVAIGYSLPATAQSGFTPVREPVYNGKRFVHDLPVSLHMKNVGGSDGAGLCVFTSIELAAKHQGVEAGFGLQKYMTRFPGGSYPQKTDQVLTRFFAETGLRADYLQHTGGDERFLELALRTGRPVSITYSGRDDFYRGPIAHMVNLAYLDQDMGVIQDNNRPGVWLVMSRTALIERWKDRSMGGGWAVVWLEAPAPAHPEGPPVPPPGPAPAPAPQPPPQPRRPCPGPGPCPAYEEASELARSAGLPLVTWVGLEPAHYHEGTVTAFTPTLDGAAEGDVWVSVWVGGRHLGKRLEPRFVSDGGKVIALAESLGWQAGRPLTGVDASNVPAEESYTRTGGRKITRTEAYRLVGADLPDDSAKWVLCFKGSKADREAFLSWVQASPVGALKPKLHITTYDSAAWQVADRMGGAEVSFHQSRSAGGKRVWSGPLDKAAVVHQVRLALDPDYKPEPPPKPPSPDPKPKPQPDAPTDPWKLLLLAALAYFVWRSESKRKDY